MLEGIYAQTGTLCPLGEINDLCKRHKVRILLDESVSFGVLGATGRGATEHFGIKVQSKIFTHLNVQNFDGKIYLKFSGNGYGRYLWHV